MGDAVETNAQLMTRIVGLERAQAELTRKIDFIAQHLGIAPQKVTDGRHETGMGAIISADKTSYL